MADIDNFSEISDNFETIKTLLNSIRAQGILNTSDVDKLLSGINTKLEKINTEEDIDLIKAFLTELKQNLDERHNVLISKFSAIESLFSNLLKNSADTLKSSEIKELFDIVATNLSVFSREVVSQKETLNDITLRIDAMRTDESQKKDIIKNINVLRTDIEHLSNGFDSIVLSLNDNFKTVVKTISGIDHTDDINKFGDQLNDIVNSSNTVLAALQLLDKKNTQIEDSISLLATKDDISGAKKSMSELAAQSKVLADSIETVTEKSYKIDVLSEKIDASVNIIAGLKAVISESNEQSAQTVITKLEQLEQTLKEVTSNNDFEEFKNSLEIVLKGISEGSLNLQTTLSSASEEIRKINLSLQALDINVGFQQLVQDFSKQTQDVKEQVITESGKLSQLLEVNVTRTLSNISSNAESLNSRLKETQIALADLCEKSFVDVLEGIANLKSVVSQIDENSVSANNAIFSNISDRLVVFENNLKTSLNNQEKSVSNSSDQITEQIIGISKLASGIDYKLDSSIIEISNSKRGFEELKTSVDNVLALDFVNTVKDLRVDLYAIKQDLSETVESSDSDLSDKITNDLFGKYELLISKLDNVEDEIKAVQKSSLDDMKFILDKISSSLMDILSYVSVGNEADTIQLDSKLQAIADKVQDANLNYVEHVRDIVDVIKTQVENNLAQIENNVYEKIDTINVSIGAYTEILRQDIKNTHQKLVDVQNGCIDIKENLDSDKNELISKIDDVVSIASDNSKNIESNAEFIRQDIKNTYQKLVDVQDNFNEIKETLNLNNMTISNDVENIIASADSLKSEFEEKMVSLKNSILDKVSDFKQEFSCENADKISELKFNSETLHSKAVQTSYDLKNELRDEITGVVDSLKRNVNELSELISSSTLKMEGANKEVIDYIKNDFCMQVNSALDILKNELTGAMTELGGNVSDVRTEFDNLAQSVNKLSEDTTTSLSSTLAKILENFVMLKSVVNGSGEQISANFKQAVEDIKNDFQFLASRFSSIDKEIDEDLARQINIIEANFNSINNLISDLQRETEEKLADRIQLGLDNIAENMRESLSEKLDDYKLSIEDVFDKIKSQGDVQADFLHERAKELNDILQNTLYSQSKDTANQLEDIATNLKNILNENIEVTAQDYDLLKEKLNGLVEKLSENNLQLVEEIKSQLSSYTKFVNSGIEAQAQEANTNYEDISSGVQKIASAIRTFNAELDSKIEAVKTEINCYKENNETVSKEQETAITTKLLDLQDSLENELLPKMQELNAQIFAEMQSVNSNIDIKLENLKIEVSNDINNNIVSAKEQVAVCLDNLNNCLDKSINETSAGITNEIKSSHEDIINKIQNTVKIDIINNLDEIFNKVQSLFEGNSLNISSLLNNTSSLVLEELRAENIEIKASFEKLNERLDRDELSHMNVYQAQFKELSTSFTEFIEDSVNSKLDNIIAATTAFSTNQLQSMEAYADKIVEFVQNANHNTVACKDVLAELIQKQFDLVISNIEKETDVIAGDLLEQFNLLKDEQKDDITSMVSQIEGSVAGYILDSVNDLKSYFDIKSDSTVIDSKLDNLRLEMERSGNEVLENINKMIEVSVFESSISELRATNQILVTSMAEKLNTQITDFIQQNVSKKFDEKLNLFDKKFIDALVDKLEEVKIIASQYNTGFDKISISIQDLIGRFIDSKNDINEALASSLKKISTSVDDLRTCFNDLKNQIADKSYEEELKDNINDRIADLENLVKEQFEYIEDINELCSNNLPELTEMNTIVKYGIQESIKDMLGKIDSNDFNMEQCLAKLKSDIVTQFINVFNQISFVAEQEEILDFIQEKHADLITILSHIVTTSDVIEDVKDNLAVVDNKMDNLQEDINLINEKITSIMSSDGDIEYVYSLQDLETDITNLRVVLNDMKDKIPQFEAEEFKKEFNNLSEDIISISSRTNKLLLASDESYKTLQDNLQDFKLVINDLDERTKNFAHESGMDIIDRKLGSINKMMQNGEKTNQVFNQVFEYLAEWVDKAGEQISKISDKVETLNDMDQIRVMLEDLKVQSSDTSVSEELIDALGTVFEKQAKRISSLEAKLDRVIVENNISKRDNKLDLTPMEDTLNRFLASMDIKISSQQEKISSLETKLEEVMSLVDNKDTAQLSKKVGGMDKQIAKLNKSIEKIASHVVEK